MGNLEIEKFEVQMSSTCCKLSDEQREIDLFFVRCPLSDIKKREFISGVSLKLDVRGSTLDF